MEKREYTPNWAIRSMSEGALVSDVLHKASGPRTSLKCFTLPLALTDREKVSGTDPNRSMYVPLLLLFSCYAQSLNQWCVGSQRV